MKQYNAKNNKSLQFKRKKNINIHLIILGIICLVVLIGILIVYFMPNIDKQKITYEYAGNEKAIINIDYIAKTINVRNISYYALVKGEEDTDGHNDGYSERSTTYKNKLTRDEIKWFRESLKYAKGESDNNDNENYRNDSLANQLYSYLVYIAKNDEIFSTYKKKDNDTFYTEVDTNHNYTITYKEYGDYMLKYTYNNITKESK